MVNTNIKGIGGGYTTGSIGDVEGFRNLSSLIRRERNNQRAASRVSQQAIAQTSEHLNAKLPPVGAERNIQLGRTGHDAGDIHPGKFDR